MENFSSLKDAYADCFPIGAAVGKGVIDTHQDILTKHFNSITCENVMKTRPIHPHEDEFNFAPADEIVQFARGRDMLVRGHTVVWENQMPDWLFRGEDGESADRETVLERLEYHINTVLSHFAGDVYCWDVVNEATSDEEGELLRNTPWLETVGEDYIEKAFEFAHRADPDSRLFYNEYCNHLPEKRRKVVRLLTQLKRRGVPVHGVGIEGHWSIHGLNLDDIKAAIEAYAELDLEVQITELDLSLFFDDQQPEGYSEPPPRLLEKQAETYSRLFELFRSYRDVITGVTLWGVADDRTWKDNHPVKGRKDWPLLFDTQHHPKEALRQVIDAGQKEGGYVF